MSGVLGWISLQHMLQYKASDETSMAIQARKL